MATSIDSIFRLSNLFEEGDRDDSEMLLASIFVQIVEQFEARTPPQPQTSHFFQLNVKRMYKCRTCSNSHQKEDVAYTLRLRIDRKPKDTQQAITKISIRPKLIVVPIAMQTPFSKYKRPGRMYQSFCASYSTGIRLVLVQDWPCIRLPSGLNWCRLSNI